MATGGPCLLLDLCTDDTLLHVASLLAAKDLLRLGLACRRLGAKTSVVAATSAAVPAAAAVDVAQQAGAAAAAASPPQMRSLVEEASRRGFNEQERGWAPCRDGESLLGLLREVELLRLPLAFGRAHPSMTISAGGAVATKAPPQVEFSPAASKVVMKSGRHFAEFTVLSTRAGIMFGVIRPNCIVESNNAYAVPGHCFYNTASGQSWRCSEWHSSTGTRWEGKQHAREVGDRIGMLLDLDQGSMTVWKNGERMGVMVVEGLRGPFCWAVEVLKENGRVRIGSAPTPASPTAEQLAAAKAWQAAVHTSDSDLDDSDESDLSDDEIDESDLSDDHQSVV